MSETTMAAAAQEKAPAANRSRSGRAVAGVAAAVARLFQVVLVLAALVLIFNGFSMVPESAIHQILQQNSITSGLILLGVTGCWTALTALATR